MRSFDVIYGNAGGKASPGYFARGIAFQYCVEGNDRLLGGTVDPEIDQIP
jgi:hypothetical protein